MLRSYGYDIMISKILVQDILICTRKDQPFQIFKILFNQQTEIERYILSSDKFLANLIHLFVQKIKEITQIRKDINQQQFSEWHFQFIDLEILRKYQTFDLDILNYLIQYSLPQMKYLAAYTLIALSGKKDINAKDIKALLGSVESHATDDDINRVINSLKGKNIHQLISEGHNRLGSSASTPAVQAAKPAKETKKEQPKKKEEPKKKEQPKPVQQDEDLGGLFD